VDIVLSPRDLREGDAGKSDQFPFTCTINMSSPAKKRKLNSDAKQKSGPARGLEYFFAKQRQNGSSSSAPPIQDGTAQPEQSKQALTDEELARKLQAEWDAEVRGSSGQNTPQHDDNGVDADAEPVLRPQSSPPDPELPSPQDPVQRTAVKNTLSLSSVAATEDQTSASIPLDESPLTFTPANHIPQLQASWAAEGGDASYALLTRCFVLVNGTQSRIKIVDTLVNCIRLLIEGDPSSLLPAVWLATNAISPPYISMELGLGGSAISKALKQACGLDNRALKALYDRVGDPGDVAFEAKKKQSFTLRKPKPLTIKGVFQSLVKIAKAQGPGSGDVKQRIVDKLLQDARGGEESRYIVRTLCQHVCSISSPSVCIDADST
jgi:DNA ligase-1